MNPNAVEPYEWEAVYTDGTVVRQFDPVLGFQKSSVIDAGKIAELRIHGHPSGAIRLAAPMLERPVDEVRIQRTTDVQMSLGGEVVGVLIARYFGFRVGAQWFLLRIDDDGRVQCTDRFE